MPYYILSTVSCIKNNEYKIGYSSKNKRLITNPFIVQWWDITGTVK